MQSARSKIFPVFFRRAARQLRRVVEARRVQKEDRSQRQELGRLLHDVGRRPRHGGGDGDLLADQVVQEARFADVRPAEDGDVESISLRCRIHFFGIPVR